MVVRRRIAAAVSMLSVGLVSFVVTSATVDAQPRAVASIVNSGGGGGGGGTFVPAGNYTFTNANASMCCGGLTITVNRSSSKSNPLVGASTSTNELDVSFNICDFINGVCGSGCFVARASDFTFASDLSSATLSTTFDGSQAMCPQPFGGPAVNFQPPLPAQPTFTLSGTWQNVGPVASARTVSRFACAGYTSETSLSGSSANGVSASTAISLEPNVTFGPIGGLFSTSNQTIHAQGTAADSCNDVGGKGAGPGPQQPGNYQFGSRQAFVTLLPSGRLTMPLNVSINAINNVSTPRGGATTTQTETDLNLSDPLFPPAIQGCFVLPPGAITISSSGASVHAAIDIDGATQQCQFAQAAFGLPDEFNVDITWTPSGPPATFRSDTTFMCGTLNTSGSSLQTGVNANASGQVSGVTDPFVGVLGNISTTSSNLHVVKVATC